MKRFLLLALAGMLLATVRVGAAPDEKEGTIEGLAIKRAGTGWLGLQLKDNCFQLTFYNDKKNPVPADRDSAIMKWPVHYQPNDERTELTPTDNPAVFGSQYPVKAPHTFKLYITLLIPGSSDVESYVVDFNAA